MKKRLCWILLFSVLLSFTGVFAAQGQMPAVTAESYLVMDQTTGQILIEQNSRMRKYPASITKILTMALAMKKCGGDMSQPLTVSYSAVANIGQGGSAVGFMVGEEITLRDAFYAALLMSGNDGANVLAEYVSGSIEAFVDLMNATVQELGLTDTHFANAHGYFDADHYTSAYDIAVITRYAMSIDGFAEFFASTRYDMPPTNSVPDGRIFSTDNQMMTNTPFAYAGTTGGKSGWTQESLYTNVITCNRDGHNLIAVVMGSTGKEERYKDIIALLDYCYDNFSLFTFAGASVQPYTLHVTGVKEVPLADITAQPTDVTFYLPNELTAEDVCYMPAVAPDYTLSGGIAPVFSLSLKTDSAGMPRRIVAGVPMQVNGIEDALVASAAPPRKKIEWLSTVGWILLWTAVAAVGGFALVVGGFVLYCLYLKRQQTRRRALRRQQALRGDTAVSRAAADAAPYINAP